MPILLFQALIIATLIVTRAFSRKALTITAIIWSGFTLVMVFMPWLMGVQLAIIWITHSILLTKTKRRQ